MNWIRTFAWLALVLTAATAGAQDRVLTLDACIRQAQDQSPEAKIARQGYETVYWSYKSYRAGLLPQVGLRANTPGLNRAINSITLDDGTRVPGPNGQAWNYRQGSNGGLAAEVYDTTINGFPVYVLLVTAEPEVEQQIEDLLLPVLAAIDVQPL